jgi:hypothetical protein
MLLAQGPCCTAAEPVGFKVVETDVMVRNMSVIRSSIMAKIRKLVPSEVASGDGRFTTSNMDRSGVLLPMSPHISVGSGCQSGLRVLGSVPRTTCVPPPRGLALHRDQSPGQAACTRERRLAQR